MVEYEGGQYHELCWLLPFVPPRVAIYDTETRFVRAGNVGRSALARNS